MRPLRPPIISKRSMIVYVRIGIFDFNPIELYKLLWTLHVTFFKFFIAFNVF